MDLNDFFNYKRSKINEGYKKIKKRLQGSFQDNKSQEYYLVNSSELDRMCSQAEKGIKYYLLPKENSPEEILPFKNWKKIIAIIGVNCIFIQSPKKSNYLFFYSFDSQSNTVKAQYLFIFRSFDIFKSQLTEIQKFKGLDEYLREKKPFPESNEIRNNLTGEKIGNIYMIKEVEENKFVKINNFIQGEIERQNNQNSSSCKSEIFKNNYKKEPLLSNSINLSNETYNLFNSINCNNSQYNNTGTHNSPQPLIGGGGIRDQSSGQIYKEKKNNINNPFSNSTSKNYNNCPFGEKDPSEFLNSTIPINNNNISLNNITTEDRLSNERNENSRDAELANTSYPFFANNISDIPEKTNSSIEDSDIYRGINSSIYSHHLGSNHLCNFRESLNDFTLNSDLSYHQNENYYTQFNNRNEQNSGNSIVNNENSMQRLFNGSSSEDTSVKIKKIKVIFQENNQNSYDFEIEVDKKFKVLVEYLKIHYGERITTKKFYLNNELINDYNKSLKDYGIIRDNIKILIK